MTSWKLCRSYQTMEEILLGLFDQYQNVFTASWKTSILTLSKITGYSPYSNSRSTVLCRTYVYSMVGSFSPWKATEQPNSYHRRDTIQIRSQHRKQSSKRTSDCICPSWEAEVGLYVKASPFSFPLREPWLRQYHAALLQVAYETNSSCRVWESWFYRIWFYSPPQWSIRWCFVLKFLFANLDWIKSSSNK